MLASPIDIKTKYFGHNNQVQLSYLKQVLKDDFEFNKSKKIIRYNPFYVDSQKTGTPYEILKKDFFTPEILDVPIAEPAEEEDLPF